jgi:hypothetical protein
MLAYPSALQCGQTFFTYLLIVDALACCDEVTYQQQLALSKPLYRHKAA